MDTSVVSSKFQVVIPRKIRDRFNLKPGQVLTFIPYRNSMRLVVVPPIEQARGILAGMKTDNLREETDEPR